MYLRMFADMNEREAHMYTACCTCECVALHMRGSTLANLSDVWLCLYSSINYSYKHDALVCFLCMCTCVCLSTSGCVCICVLVRVRVYTL